MQLGDVEDCCSDNKLRVHAWCQWPWMAVVWWWLYCWMKWSLVDHYVICIRVMLAKMRFSGLTLTVRNPSPWEHMPLEIADCIQRLNKIQATTLTGSGTCIIHFSVSKCVYFCINIYIFFLLILINIIMILFKRMRVYKFFFSLLRS